MPELTDYTFFISQLSHKYGSHWYIADVEHEGKFSNTFQGTFYESAAQADQAINRFADRNGKVKSIITAEVDVAPGFPDTVSNTSLFRVELKIEEVPTSEPNHWQYALDEAVAF